MRLSAEITNGEARDDEWGRCRDSLWGQSSNRHNFEEINRVPDSVLVVSCAAGNKLAQIAGVLRWFCRRDSRVSIPLLKSNLGG